MKLTTRSEYALLAMVYLARQPIGSVHSAETIANAQHIPAKFLEQLLAAMRMAHFVRSTKGKSGGYSLAKDPHQINLAEIIRLFDGALAPVESVSSYFYEPTPIEREAGLVNVLREIRDHISTKLENTTIAQIADTPAGNLADEPEDTL